MSNKEDSTGKDRYQFKISGFEGPLDLLLFLIKKNEINIYDIPIAEITEQYLEFLEYAAKIDLDNIIEFYSMAATLIYIKSKMLLPIDDIDLNDIIEDPRKELVEKLIEYQKYKKLSEIMLKKEEEYEWSIERKKNQRLLPFTEENIWEDLTVWDLLQTFSSIIGSISKEKFIDLFEEVTINEKITLINEYLDKQSEILFTVLIQKNGSIMEVVCAFFAVLDLVKQKRISVQQNRLFGDIRIIAV